MSIQPKALLAFTFVLSIASLGQAQTNSPSTAATDGSAGAGAFVTLLTEPAGEHKAAYDTIRDSWQPGYVTMALEVIHLSRDRAVERRLIGLLQKQTGQRFSFDIDRWYDWLWQQEEQPAPSYAEFKSAIYSLIDAKFKGYFSSQRTSLIRLDEVRWGGVPQDGIPPLRQPQMISAAEADYLDDEDVVFGIEINGDVRAYPQRILAWHEMFVDTVGAVPVAGVYCTLCGTVIIYETTVAETNYHLGTSGFLYRSNKLMYDQASQSLWNTLWGRPVIGPLVGQDIELERRSVVTTTWGEWRRRHPRTQVLSLDTGHRRDYAEGAAYRRYFATDELMFSVPKLDQRLKNKDQVLGIQVSEHPDQPLAIAVAYLAEKPLYHDQIGELPFVVLTDNSGAARVYESAGLRFASWDRDHTAVDESGTSWTLHEDRLATADGRLLPRLPAHRAFWFGWYSAYSHTRLVH